MGLIGIDMDGRVLKSEEVIGEENKEGIKEGEGKGVDVVIRTGRRVMRWGEVVEAVKFCWYV
ncbi:HAD hydrolase family protein, partial [Bacillus altitudinis]|uniref:HAD hydrolase family protein n=1 Tax=Bacillus altitudinis TaxID=293387 RepID=UPI001C92C853